MNSRTGSIAQMLLFLLLLSAITLTPYALAQRSLTGQVEKVADGFQFVEGPVWKDGYGLLFSDMNGNTVYHWSADSGVTVFLANSGKANGLAFDLQGRLVMAKQGDRQVTRLESNGTQTILASTYGGKRLNSPNDLVIKSDGSIWFTDPPYGILPSPGELGYSGIFRISPSGSLTLLDKTLARPNGIAFTPDSSKLYVGDAETRRIYLWDVQDSTISNKRLFASITPSGYADGMKVNPDGYLFATGPYGVWVYAPDGTFIDTILVPGQTTNCNWGDDDRKTLYITSGKAVYRVRPTITALSAESDFPCTPESPWLSQNYPNPFNPKTLVRSQTPEVSDVRIVIYDLLGREVKVLVDERRAAGTYEDVFDASGLASGVYVYRLTTGSFVQSKRMVLVK